jgi:outer membrane protein OmpA-like peptidoglycan-associated protein
MGSCGVSTGRRAMPRRFAACFAILLLSAACATVPKTPPPPGQDVFILLPDDQGKTGAIIVSGAGGKQLLSQPGQAVTVAPGAPPGKPFIMPMEEVRTLVGPALKALPKTPLRFILYFPHDDVELTKESRAKVREVIRAIKERNSTDVSVVGHTDRVGTRRYNYRLSLERARAVASFLIAEGVDPSILAIDSHGEDNPLIPTRDKVSEPRNRRVEVTVR